MAFQMIYQDSAGNNYAASYWYLAELFINAHGRIITITYLGYGSAAAQAAGFGPVGVHAYQIPPASFVSTINKIISGTNGPWALADAFVTSANELQNDPFFTGAVQVANPTLS